MWLQRFTSYLLQHFWQSLALTFIITFIPIVGIVSVLIAGLMTLLKGAKQGALFMLAATLPYVITFYFAGGHEPSMPLVAWAAVGVAVLSNLLTWAFAVMLYKKASWSNMIQVAALFGVLVISLIHFAYPNVADWWGAELQAYYHQAQNVTNAIKGTSPTEAVDTTVETQVKAINITKQYATGLMVGAILFNAIVQLIVARWWQAALFQPGILRRELRNIRLSRLAGTLFVVSLVFSYMENTVVYDMMPVLFMLFGAAGLSLVHYFFGMMRTPTVWFWLVLVYVTLIIAMPTSIVLVSLLALLDIWFDLRKRIKKV